MDSKHTWRIDAGRHGLHIRSGKPTDALGGELVAQAFSTAHASLIAAAPDLLSALIALTDGVLSENPHRAVACIKTARAAIAKATGAQQ
jgi:hypothetical protein